MNTFKQRLRDALRHAGRDTRGVALQTVIVIVVLLMIAGGVSAVLLSRSSDVVGQLEAQGVGALTEDNCKITRVGGVTGQTAKDDAGWVKENTSPTHCVWAVKGVTAAQCFAAGNGTINGGGNSGKLKASDTSLINPRIDDAICAAEITAA